MERSVYKVLSSRHGCCSPELTVTVVTHRRPAQDPASQHSGVDGGEAHETQSLAKELLAVDKKISLSSGLWPLVGCPYSSEWPHTHAGNSNWT